MRIKITAGGIYNAKGEEVAVGTELTVKKEPTAWRGRYVVLEGDGKGKTAVTGEKAAAGGSTDEKPTFTAPFEAKEKGGGWWGIVDATGADVGKSIRKDDAEAFNGLSDDDKAAFVAEHTKEA